MSCAKFWVTSIQYNMKKNNLFLIILFIITTIYYLPVINLPLAPLDEAFILVSAEKILNGQIPHKDFSSEYPLGQTVTLAALFKVFGVTVMTERIYDLVIKSLLSLSIFMIIRFLTSNITAIFGWVMALIWLQHSSMPAYPVYPSITLIFIGIYLLLLHMKEQRNYYVILSALFIVLATLFRHDLGGYAAIVIALVLTLRRFSGEQSWTPLISFIVSSVLAVLPVIIYFYMHSAIGYLYNDLILMPLNMVKYQTLPYPSLSRWNLPFYMFPLVVLTGAISSIFLLLRKKNDAIAYAVLLISLLGIFFFNQARWRSDMVHLIPVALTGILLAPVLLYTLSKRLVLSRLSYSVVCLMFIIIFGITLSKPVSVINMLLTSTNGYVIAPTNPDFERASYSKISPELKDTVAYIKNNTAINDDIYVGVKNHDRFVFNDVIIYFLAQRDSATRYHLLNPGYHSTVKVQKEVINEFRNNPPKLIVLTLRSRYEPNLGGIDTKTDLLDNYIATNYEFKEKYGLFEIWMQKL